MDTVKYNEHIEFQSEIVFLESIWRQNCRNSCHVHVKLCFGKELPDDLVDTIAKHMWNAAHPVDLKRTGVGMYSIVHKNRSNIIEKNC